MVLPSMELNRGGTFSVVITYPIRGITQQNKHELNTFSAVISCQIHGNTQQDLPFYIIYKGKQARIRINLRIENNYFVCTLSRGISHL